MAITLDFKKHGWLLAFELTFLSLMILSLPSVEGPKNIFLVLFVTAAILRQIKTRSLHVWGAWDWIFLGFVGCAFLSAVFAGLAPGGEWSGFSMLLTYTMVGWLIARSGYSVKISSWLFWLIVLSTIPPLVWGVYKCFYLHEAKSLQLHSVGHVNHSAIYLTIIFGASLGAALSFWRTAPLVNRLLLVLLPIAFYLSLIIGLSRGAFGVATFMAILLITLCPASKLIRMAFFFLLGVSLVALLLLNVEIINKQREQERSHEILAKRDLVWNVPLEAAKFYPLFGIGMNNWKYIKLDNIKKSVEQRNEAFNPDMYLIGAGHAHNLYLQALLERGIVGLTSILALMIFWLREIIFSFKLMRLTPYSSCLWAASLSAWASTFLIGLVNSTLHHEHGILAFLFLGLFLNELHKKTKD